MPEININTYIDSVKKTDVTSLKYPVNGIINSNDKQDEFVKVENNFSEIKEQSKNKKLSQKTKLILASVGASIALVVGALNLAYGRMYKAGKFALNITFKEAQTIDEAIKFARDNFKIKRFEFGNDLEFMNWINEGLCNINNRFKGKVYIPKTIRFMSEKELAQNSNAAAFVDVTSKDMVFNQNIFNKQNLLNTFFDFTDSTCNFKETETGEFSCKTSIFFDSHKLMELYPDWKKIKENPDSVSRFELHRLNYKIQDIAYGSYSPKTVLNNLLNTEKFNKKLKDKNIEVNFDEFLKLDYETQKNFIINLCHKVGIKKLVGGGTSRSNSIFDTLYHEMGHAQHFCNISLYDFNKGMLSDKATEEFLKNSEAQKIAGKISWYAQTSPIEFVAETFKALMSGKELSPETLELYKQYKGPIIPNM